MHRTVGHRALLPPFGDLREPGVVGRRLHARVDRREHVLDVRHDAEVDAHVLADGRRVAVHMDDLRLLRVRGELAGHAVREARAQRDDQVRLVDRVVRRRRAVHAREAQRKRVRLREGAEAHERRRHGDLRLARELGDLLRGARRQHAAARVDHGALGLVDELREARELAGRRRGLRVVGAQRDALRVLRGGERPLHVLRHVDDDGARLAVRGDVERLGHDLGDLVRALQQEAVLGDRAADAAHVRLLERVRADLPERNLARDAHERHAVHVRGREAGDRVGRAGAGRHEADAGASRGARVAVGHVHAALLVAAEDELERRLGEAVEYVQDRAARISEQHLRAGLRQRVHQRLRARLLFFLLHLLSRFCLSQACALRSPRAARDRIFHSTARRSSASTPEPLS